VTAKRIEHPDPEALRQSVVKVIVDGIQAGLSERGAAVFAVSGGKSPVPLFEALATMPLPWERVTVTLVDERFLPTDHPDSNEALVRRHLLQGAAAAATFVGLRNSGGGSAGAASLEAAATAADRTLATLPQPFDVMILGMGEDGHTASWFPDGDRLAVALDLGTKQLVIPMIAENAPATPERLTLTLKVVAAARTVLLPLEGAGKLATLERALQPGPIEQMPIRAAITHANLQIHTAR
jgi:6-phosphogluconolactonase